MRLNHLTFGQLYKLAHPRTLMRVENAYHSALRVAWWKANWGEGQASWDILALGVLKKQSPAVAARYEPVLAFLRGPELKAALKATAAVQDIPQMPGAALELCRVRRSRLAAAHMNIVYTFCRLGGALVHPVRIEDGSIVVRVDTTPLGIAALTYRPGLKWKTIKQECAIENTFPHSVFWWLNLVEPLKDNDRFNPAVWPCNTPDVSVISESLVTRV